MRASLLLLMNMSSFNGYKRNTSVLKPLIIVGASIACVIVVWYIARSITHRTVAQLPLASTDTVINTLLPKKTLVHKVVELQTTLASYDARLATLDLLQAENDALKRELGRAEHPKGVLAHVVTLPNRSLYDTFTIDAGSAQNIREGQIAYAFDSIALGTISAVADDHATVTLFSAPGRETTGSANGSNIAVTMIGRGGGEYEVRMPRDVQFAVGGMIAHQTVQTAVLAQIERIATDPRDPFQRLIAKAPVNLQALKWVIVR